MDPSWFSMKADKYFQLTRRNFNSLKKLFSHDDDEHFSIPSDPFFISGFVKPHKIATRIKRKIENGSIFKYPPVWFMDDSKDDQRLEHHRNPQEFLDLEQLKATTGVLYWKLNPETYDTDGVLDKIRKDRGYSYQDIIECSQEKLPCYEEKLKIFFTEHLHTEEEIRYIIDGSGYFDVRNGKDDWIRIEVVRGDLIILPAGIYHRFTLDSKNFAKAMRLFIGEPIWTPHNRPCDDMKERKQYLQQLEVGFN